MCTFAFTCSFIATNLFFWAFQHQNVYFHWIAGILKTILKIRELQEPFATSCHFLVVVSSAKVIAKTVLASQANHHSFAWIFSWAVKRLP